MRRLFRSYVALVKAGFAEMVAYRAELFIWILSATTPVIMLLVWDRAAENGPIQGFDRPDFARYFTASLVVRQLASAWLVWELNHLIRTGELSPALLKPVHPFAFRAAENLVALPFRIVVLAPLVGLLVLWRPEIGMPLSWSALPLIFPSPANLPGGRPIRRM